MTKHYIDKDGIEYTPKQVRKSKPKISYWVIFPQGIEKKIKWGVMTSNLMNARNYKQAVKLCKKYNGAYIERMLNCKYARWCLDQFAFENLSIEELWDKYQKLPKIKK